MSEKQCNKCKDYFPLTSDFYHKNRTTKDGFQNICRPCRIHALKKYNKLPQTKAIKRKWRATNAEKERERMRQYRKRNPQYETESSRRWRRNNKDKQKAQELLRRAVDRGEIIRHPCVICGAPKSQGHHHDYSRPFDVKWLCAQHHADEHTAIRKRAEGEK